jgi:hypothetical protein
MRRTKSGHWVVTEYTVLEVFLGIAAFGLLVGSLFSVLYGGTGGEDASALPPPSAMSDDDYQAQVRSITAPFLAEAAKVRTRADVAKEGPSALDLVTSTEDGLVRMDRIPSEERDVHLSLVLLLDKWKRALTGSAADADALVAKTDEVLGAVPWLDASNGAAAP